MSANGRPLVAPPCLSAEEKRAKAAQALFLAEEEAVTLQSRVDQAEARVAELEVRVSELEREHNAAQEASRRA